MSRAKVIFLTGAPLQSELSNDQLINELEPSVNRFIQGSHDNNAPEPTPSHRWPDWRALQEGHEYAASTNDERTAQQEEPFLPLSTDPQSQNSVNYHFLEQSLADYRRASPKDLPSNTSFDDSTYMQESFLSDLAEESFVTSLGALKAVLPAFVTNLRALPKADYVEKCYPQTITVNLLVGIISIAPARAVLLRRRGAGTMELVEAVVGDESKTGLSITFWLPVEGDAEDPLRRNVERLRSRHIVLLTNVALRVWQGRVYGQSLNKRVCKHETSIIRLDTARRSKEDGTETDVLPTPLQSKFDRVEKWVWDFLLSAEQSFANPDTASAGKRKRRRFTLVDQDALPPDTQ